MPSMDFPEPDSDASEIARMRRIVAAYDSCEDSWLKSEYLDAQGLTREVVINYRKIVARADLRASPTPPVSGDRFIVRASRRSRPRRAPSSRSSRANDTTRPGDSRRNRSIRSRVVFFVIVLPPDSPDAS